MHRFPVPVPHEIARAKPEQPQHERDVDEEQATALAGMVAAVGRDQEVVALEPLQR
jgi:hypothetical protein